MAARVSTLAAFSPFSPLRGVHGGAVRVEMEAAGFSAVANP